MNRRRDFDDFGQVDGDASVAFVASGAGVPWLREGVPPWHMWGNSQTIQVTATGSDEAEFFVPGQLAKIAYKRPETWHFLLAARIINGPEVVDDNAIVVQVRFDIITGIGRSQSQLVGFDLFNWGWVENEIPPTNTLWATTAKTPALRSVFNAGTGVFDPDPASIRDVSEIVGQDIQVTCGVSLAMAGFPEGPRPTATVEVSAYFAPKTHVRPDWYVKGMPELQFGGAEVQGR